LSKISESHTQQDILRYNSHRNIVNTVEEIIEKIKVVPDLEGLVLKLSEESTFRNEECVQGAIRDLTVYLSTFNRVSSYGETFPTGLQDALKSIQYIVKFAGLKIEERREKNIFGREKYDTYPAVLISNSEAVNRQFKKDGLIDCDDLLIAHLDTAASSEKAGCLTSRRTCNEEILEGGALIDMTSQLATAIVFACSLKFSDYSERFGLFIPTDEEIYLTHTRSLYKISSKIKNVKDLEPTGNYNGYFIDRTFPTISFSFKPSSEILDESYMFCKKVKSDLSQYPNLHGKRVHVSRNTFDYFKLYIEQDTETDEGKEKGIEIGEIVQLYFAHNFDKNITLVLDKNEEVSAGVNPEFRANIAENERFKLNGAFKKVYPSTQKFVSNQSTLPTKVYPHKEGRGAILGPNFLSTAMLSMDENKQPVKNWSVLSYSEIHAGENGRHFRESLNTKEPLNLFKVLQYSIIPEYINQLEG
jgi:hypothetical protein